MACTGTISTSKISSPYWANYRVLYLRVSNITHLFKGLECKIEVITSVSVRLSTTDSCKYFLCSQLYNQQGYVPGSPVPWLLCTNDFTLQTDWKCSVGDTRIQLFEPPLLPGFFKRKSNMSDTKDIDMWSWLPGYLLAKFPCLILISASSIFITLNANAMLWTTPKIGMQDEGGAHCTPQVGVAYKVDGCKAWSKFSSKFWLLNYTIHPLWPYQQITMYIKLSAPAVSNDDNLSMEGAMQCM